jgi:hypothetical protein
VIESFRLILWLNLSCFIICQDKRLIAAYTEHVDNGDWNKIARAVHYSKQICYQRLEEVNTFINTSWSDQEVNISNNYRLFVKFIITYYFRNMIVSNFSQKEFRGCS